MDLVSLLLAGVGVPAATLLLRRWITGGDAATISNDLGENVSDELIKIAAKKIEGILSQNKAKREFEALGEKIAIKLLPLFEDATKSVAFGSPKTIDAAKVIRELRFTLGTQPTPSLLVKEDLDPAKIAAEMRARHLIDLTLFTDDERELYEMALDSSVRHIVNLAAALPAFQSVLAKETLERLSRIGDDLDHVLDVVQRIEQAVVKDSADTGARYEADYRQAVIRKLDYLELFGADIPAEARNHSLSVSYVSLNLEGEWRNGHANSLLVEEVLDQLTPEAGRLLIRGEAGSGKSTLFRWAAIQASVPIQIGRRTGTSAGSSDDPGDYPRRLNWRQRIPFLIRLRDFTDGRLPAPDNFPELVAKELGTPPIHWVRKTLHSGNAIVLLDGVDEIPGSMRDVLKAEIKAIVDAYPKNYFLVSTRPQAVESAWLARERFREATVNPMNDTDKAILIDRWHQGVSEELRRRGENDTRLEGMAERLKAKLRDNPSTNRLAKYPLLAAMVCAFHRRNSEHLPASEVELIERLCFMLLDDRDRLSGLRNEALPDTYSTLEYRHKKLIVQDLAYHMLVHKGESSIATSAALDQVQHRLVRLGMSGVDPRVILTALIERSGMLREPVQNRIDFLHNAFKEYLTALRLVEENADGLLASHWNDAEWLPVLLFAAATEKQTFATGLITKILHADSMEPIRKATRSEKPTEASRVTRQRQVFALRCRAVALDIDPALQRRLDDQRAALFPPQTLADAEALATVGDLAVEYLRLGNALTVKERAASVRALRLIGTKKAHSVLREYIDDKDLAVIEEMSQSINPLEIRAVQMMVQEGFTVAKSTKEHAIRLRIVDLSPLAAIGGLTSLDLADTIVSDLSSLAGMSELVSLDLRGTKVSDLFPLARLLTLKHLNLCGTLTSDLTPLANLTALKTLDLQQTSIRDLSPLRYLIELTSLNLFRTPLRDLAGLEGLGALTTLDLSFTAVNDLKPVSSLKNLSSLDLCRTAVSDLSPLAEMRHLKTLYIRGVPATDLSPLAELRGLSMISVSQRENLRIPASIAHVIRE